MNIRYYLSLPPEKTADEVCKLFVKIRSFCLDRPFFDIGPMKEADTNIVGHHRNLIEETFPDQFFRHLSPSYMIGFAANLGNAETPNPMQMFLFEYPAYNGNAVPWFFYGSCSSCDECPDDLFVHRHLAAISALDYAKQLGMEVEVKDSGGYWKHRNRTELIELRHLLSDNILFGKVNEKLKEIL